MPVTFHPAKHDATPFPPKPEWKEEAPATRILHTLRRKQSVKYLEILQSSLDTEPGSSADSDIIPTNNGFVDTIVSAYNHHRALVIRPDDVVRPLSKLASVRESHHRYLPSGSPFLPNSVSSSTVTLSN